MPIISHEREFLKNGKIAHTAMVESKVEVDNYDVEKIAGSCGYIAYGYGCFNKSIEIIKDGLYKVCWHSSASCD